MNIYCQGNKTNMLKEAYHHCYHDKYKKKLSYGISITPRIIDTARYVYKYKHYFKEFKAVLLNPRLEIM